MKEIKFEFIVDGKYITSPYTLEEIMEIGGEEAILEDLEICDCQTNESNNHCEGDCVRFDNSKITGKRQFTGLKDRLGKDIYESDICKAPHDFGPGGWSERTFQVKFNIHNGYGWNYWDMDEIEVIGNIYETPNLLQK